MHHLHNDDTKRSAAARLGTAILGAASLLAAASFTGCSWIPNEVPDAASPERGEITLPRDLTNISQPNDYYCGPAAYATILDYFGRSYADLSSLAEELNTNMRGATWHADIKTAAEARGIDVEIRYNSSLQDIEEALAQGKPVMVLYQAWPDNGEEPWTEVWDSSHFSVVYKIDSAGVHMKDPGLRLFSREQLLPGDATDVCISRDEFEARWHHRDSTGVKHFGRCLIFSDTSAS